MKKMYKTPKCEVIEIDTMDCLKAHSGGWHDNGNNGSTGNPDKGGWKDGKNSDEEENTDLFSYNIGWDD